MFRLISSGAMGSLLLASCVQNGTGIAKLKEQNIINTGVLKADTRSEQALKMRDLLKTCDGEAMQRWIGRRFTVASETALLEASGSSTLRPVRPGQAISMDYQTDRLTIDLDGADIILALRCG